MATDRTAAEPGRSSPEQHFVETSLGRLAVRVVGEGAPAVLWHSMFVDSRTWDRIIPALARHRRLHLIDGPAFGESDPLRRPSSIAECAAVGQRVLDAFELDSVDWVGNAWGGHVGIALGAAAPARLRSLVSIGAPTHRLGGNERLQVLVLRPVARAFGFLPFITNVVAAALLSDRARADDPAAVEIVTGGFRSLPRRSFDLALKSFVLDRPDLSAEAMSLPMPVLFAAGDDRGEWTPDQARSMADRMPNATVAALRGVRGIAPLEDPPATIRMIEEFWDGLVRSSPDPSR